MWGIIPAAGKGSRIQPLAFSKELLPVGSRLEAGVERPRAVSEYLIDRMIAGGADKLCFVISPGKSDIIEYYGSSIGKAAVCYTVQLHASGLCDAIFSVIPFISATENLMIGLPDTIWFPENGFSMLPDNTLSFLLFPVEQPQFFDAVETDGENNVIKIHVKQPVFSTKWVWGAFKMPGVVLQELYELWTERNKSDEYIGTLINAYIKYGGKATGIQSGESYVDVGTYNGYREALQLLNTRNGILNNVH